MIRRLRGRFGIAAPRLSIGTHIPWHAKLGLVLAITLLILLLSGWAFNEGRGAARECDRYLMGSTDLP